MLRLECTPPYGGAKLVIDTDEIAVDPSTHQMLSQMLNRGHAEFNCVQANGGEPRILLITLKNIKVRGRLSRLTTSATTIYKQGYELPLTLVLDPHSPTEVRPLHASAHHGVALAPRPPSTCEECRGLHASAHHGAPPSLSLCVSVQVSLRMGKQSFALNFESSRVRDVAALCVRMFAGPSCPEHEDAYATEAFSEPNDGGFEEDSGRGRGGGGGGDGSGGGGGGGGGGDDEDEDEVGAQSNVVMDRHKEGSETKNKELDGVTWSDDEGGE